MKKVNVYNKNREMTDIVKKDIKINHLKLQKDEVAAVKLVTLEEFDNMIESGIVVPSINPSYLLLKNYLNNYTKK